MAQVLGIDIGGTGIKGAPVDVAAGQLTTERRRLETPHPAKPDAVARVVQELVTGFGWSGPIGCTFPGVITSGEVRTAANVDPAWIGVNAADLFSKVTGQQVAVINDADAAGLAEVKFGAGAGQRGTVLMLTFGTGIGSALFIDGTLVPNTEFGHIEIRDGAPAVAGPDHHRRRHQQALREVPAPAERPDRPRGAGEDAQRRRDRRRGHDDRPG
jgi:polyphosphate glucokinase